MWVRASQGECASRRFLEGESGTVRGAGGWTDSCGRFLRVFGYGWGAILVAAVTDPTAE
jgi:hypothetical protein